LAQSANTRAGSRFGEALSLLPRIPDSDERLRLDIDLRCELRNSLELVEPEKLIGSLAEAESMAKRLGDDRRLGNVASYMTHACWVGGRVADAIAYGTRAMAIGSKLGDAGIEIPSAYHLALAYSSRGRHVQASELFNQVIDRAPPYEKLTLNIPPAILARSYLARSLAELGEFGTSELRGNECVTLAEKIGSPYACGFAYLALGHLALVRGDYVAAIAKLQSSHRSFLESGTTVMAPAVAAFLGRAHSCAGEPMIALGLLEPAIHMTRTMRIMVQQPLRMVFLSEAYQNAGRLQDARRTVEEAIALARRQSEDASHAYGLWQIGKLQLADPTNSDCATVYLVKALALAVELNLLPLAARCRRELAKALKLKGASYDAEIELGTAEADRIVIGIEHW
jgi:tetratricopeptide (TPR) repeat protein